MKNIQLEITPNLATLLIAAVTQEMKLAGTIITLEDRDNLKKFQQQLITELRYV